MGKDPRPSRTLERQWGVSPPPPAFPGRATAVGLLSERGLPTTTRRGPEGPLVRTEKPDPAIQGGPTEGSYDRVAHPEKARQQHELQCPVDDQQRESALHDSDFTGPGRCDVWQGSTSSAVVSSITTLGEGSFASPVWNKVGRRLATDCQTLDLSEDSGADRRSKSLHDPRQHRLQNGCPSRPDMAPTGAQC